MTVEDEQKIKQAIKIALTGVFSRRNRPKRLHKLSLRLWSHTTKSILRLAQSNFDAAA